ncbi:hypothetical protein DYH09_25570 [bacterium CPR1]|nr:hypothetical protein [bacterium CPR1]
MLHFSDHELVFGYELEVRSARASGLVSAVGRIIGGCLVFVAGLTKESRSLMVALPVAAALSLPGLLERREEQAKVRSCAARRRVAQGSFLAVFRSSDHEVTVRAADGREIWRETMDPAHRVYTSVSEEGVEVWFHGEYFAAELREPFRVGCVSLEESSLLVQRLERLFG